MSNKQVGGIIISLVGSFDGDHAVLEQVEGCEMPTQLPFSHLPPLDAPELAEFGRKGGLVSARSFPTVQTLRWHQKCWRASKCCARNTSGFMQPEGAYNGLRHIYNGIKKIHPRLDM